MLVPSIVITSLAFALVSASPAHDKRWAAPVVDLGYAQYQGVYNETTNIQYFLGIRYAESTAGVIPFSFHNRRPPH
jgi:hypothetical protein